MNIHDEAELCFPQLLNNSCRKPISSELESTLLYFLLSFISLITVALNLLVIITVSHFRQLHTPTNILLLSLAVSDFLVGLLVMPLEILRITNCWFLGDIMCVAYTYLICQIVSTSIGNIILISVDRYVAICFPLHYPTRITLVRVKYCVCLCWVCAASCSFFFINDVIIQPGKNNSCLGKCVPGVNFTEGIVDIILNFIFPITVIIVLYFRIFVVAVSHARAMRSHIAVVTLMQSETVKTKKTELKAARTLGVLVIVFLACYCPYYGYSLVESNLNRFLYFIFYFNSCLNPVIYAMFYSWFRKAIKIIVTLQILKPGSGKVDILNKGLK